jgi:hypothetical protein
MVRRDFALSNRPVFCKTPIPHHSWMLLNDLNSTTNDRRGKRRGRQDGREERKREGRGGERGRQETGGDTRICWTLTSKVGTWFQAYVIETGSTINFKSTCSIAKV